MFNVDTRTFGRPVLLYDHIGFGFSDKPAIDFTYSIFELADYSLMLFEKFGLTVPDKFQICNQIFVLLFLFLFFINTSRYNSHWS